MVLQRQTNDQTSSMELFNRRGYGRVWRKITFGSALVAAFLVVPLAVRGFSDSGNESDQIAPTVSEGPASLQSASPANSSVDISINGRPMPVPADGTLRHHHASPGGSVDVRIENHQRATSGSSSQSSTTVEVNSTSEQTNHAGGTQH